MPPNIDFYAWVDERTEARCLEFARHFLTDDEVYREPLEVMPSRLEADGTIDGAVENEWLAFASVHVAIMHGVRHRGDGYAIYMRSRLEGIDQGILCLTCDGHVVCGLSVDEARLVDGDNQLVVPDVCRGADTLRGLSRTLDVIALAETPPPLSRQEFLDAVAGDLCAKGPGAD